MDTTQLLRLLLNLVRKGTILQVDHDLGTCRVATGELQTNWIPWLAIAGDTREWEPPTAGEQVLLLCPGGEPADAVAVRGLYAGDRPAPSTSPSAHVRLYPDGARIEYDHDTHQLAATLPDGATITITAPGAVTVKTGTATIEADTATVKADTITLDAGTTHCTGELEVDGNVTAGGDVKASGEVTAGDITLTGHGHMEQGDGKRVGKPLP
jgi:phage baseplate assembly protein V